MEQHLLLLFVLTFKMGLKVINEQPRLVSLCAGDSIVLKSVGDPSRTLFQAGRGTGPDVAVRLDFLPFQADYCQLRRIGVSRGHVAFSSLCLECQLVLVGKLVVEKCREFYPAVLRLRKPP